MNRFKGTPFNEGVFRSLFGDPITLPVAPTWTNSVALKLSLLSADVSALPPPD
jgi:hypothetical protein